MRPRRRANRFDTIPAHTLPAVANPELHAALLEIVDTQLRKKIPPEVCTTFDRLVGMGHSPEGARQLLAHVVSIEIFAVMARGQQYNEAHYITALKRLPALPEAES